MRSIVTILVVVGLVTILAGEVLMFSALGKLGDKLSTWTLVGLGASIIVAGLLVNVVGQKVRRRKRYRRSRKY